ncbi:Rho-GAP domain-containing protein [Fusarium keratoplasticum]|nr:Rho-GAP domain-containing protein [Fusarium keratoplasticum]
MADPLSTAASVVGLLTAAAQISKILANVIDKARHAPKECSRIKSEVDDIRNVLVTLQLYIVGTRRAARSRTSLIMVEQVVATLAACVTTFSELDTFAKALQNDADMKILDRLRWASKDKDIKAMLVRLESHKSSLTQSQDDAESRVDTLCNLVEQMLLRDLILKERLVALEARNGSEEPKETIDARLHGLSISDVDEGKTPGPITTTNKQPEWQRNSYGFAFEEILMSSRAYRVVTNDNSDAFSVISAAGRTASWSMLSGLSLSEVSHIGIQAIPIYASDITNKEHYDFSPSAPHVIQIESRQPSSPEKLSRRDRLKGLFRGPRPLGPELLPDSDPEPPIPIFGVALEESISHAHNLIIVTDEAGVNRIYGDIPLVIARAGRFLRENGNYGAKPSLYRYMLIEATYLGTSPEDTFATIGSPVRISKLQQAFESPPTYGSGLDWTQYTIHDAAGIILRYLKSLPEPIIPYDCYGEFMDGFTPYIDRELTEEESAEALKVAKRLIGMMPSLNLQLLSYVLDIMSVFASRASYLRLISIFQPSIISGPPNEMDAEAHRAASSVALMLLTHEEYIWGEMGA